MKRGGRKRGRAAGASGAGGAPAQMAWRGLGRAAGAASAAGACEAVPSDDCSYGTVQFWDERYLRSEETFEWYRSFSALAGLIAAVADREDRVLIAGCGNSSLAADMCAGGFRRIVCSDWSRVVIDQMQERFAGLGVQWTLADMTDAPFEDGQFDVVIDKAMLDCVLCSPAGGGAAGQVLREAGRLLRPGGAYVLVSRGPPEERLALLEREDLRGAGRRAWDVQVHAVAKPAAGRPCGPGGPGGPDPRDPTGFYYVYVCRKGGGGGGRGAGAGAWATARARVRAWASAWGCAVCD